MGSIPIPVGGEIGRDALLRGLVDIQYTRNDLDLRPRDVPSPR